MEEKKVPRRQSKKDLANALLHRLDTWIKEGDSPEEALERLTVRQYDFLIDYGVNLDNLILTTEQQQAIQAITKSPRRLSPNGYNKKYPQSKQELYSGLVEHLQAQSATIHEREKQNYRDLDFTLNGVHYRIVLSQPRPPKKN
jgi:hypothetical protein